MSLGCIGKSRSGRTVGTAHWDERSFEQNYEVNAIAYEGDFVGLLKQEFLKEAHGSR